MTFRLLTAPTTTPVSLAEAKEQLKVEFDDHDDDFLIQGKIDAATQQIDGPKGLLGQALMSQSWAWELDYGFPACGDIVIPFSPLISVEAVKYVDADGATQTIDTDEYQVLAHRGIVCPVWNGTWPSPRSQRAAVTVEFTAGYANAAAVPADIKAAILLTVGWLYADREPTKRETECIDNLLSRHRRWWTEG